MATSDLLFCGRIHTSSIIRAAILLFGATSFSLAGCAMMEDDDTLASAGTGAAIGAAAGAGVGAVVGGLSPIEGAVIGSAVGGIAGAVWADRDNDGYADGYVREGQYYSSRPAYADGYVREGQYYEGGPAYPVSSSSAAANGSSSGVPRDGIPGPRPPAANGGGIGLVIDIFGGALSGISLGPRPRAERSRPVLTPAARSHAAVAERTTVAQVHFCPVLGFAAEPAKCDRAQAVEKKLDRGWGDFKPTGQVVEQQPFTLEFYLGGSRVAVERRTGSAPGDPGNGEFADPGNREFNLADWMRVTLRPHPDFDATPIDPADQRLTQHKDQRWRWRLVPKRAAAAPFELVADVVPLAIADDNEKLPLRQAQREARIAVAVDWWLAADRGIERATGLSVRLKALFEGWNAVIIALSVLLATLAAFWRKLPFVKRRTQDSAIAASAAP